MELKRDTKIKLSQIVDLKKWIEDEEYEIGDISEKTGLEKFGPGDWRVPRSLGARAAEFKVKNDTAVKFKGESSYTLKEGSLVTEIETIAKGHGIDQVRKLIRKYRKQNGESTKTTDWTKKKGNGIVVDKKGHMKKGELHWYECQGMGKLEFKVKKWIE